MVLEFHENSKAINIKELCYTITLAQNYNLVGEPLPNSGDYQVHPFDTK